VPTANSGPEYITAGPDGALWFTESNLNNTGKIGRITTSGAITEYTVPTADSFPFGITAGPDGALWFTENNTAKIGRITTSGAITEYSVPTANSGPGEITAGPDGALWFTESNLNNTGKIGRITTSGTITEYTVPTANSFPFGITAGPDGALWFTEEYGNKIGRIGAASPLVITTTSLPTGTVNVAYNAPLSASGGTTPYTWTATGLPPGLTMTSGGTITGTPTSAGTFPVSFTVKDSSSPPLSATTSLPLTVTNAGGGGDILGVSPSTVTLSNGAGAGIVATLATLTNTGSAATTFTISVTTASGGNWLSATAPTNTINPNGSVSITILVDTTHLGPGPYQGTVKLHGSATTATLTANADVTGGTVSPSYINFGLITAQKPAKQTVTVTLGGTATVDVGAQMQQGSGWLTTDALNGAIDANPSAPFNVMVDASSLTPADYAGAITLQCNPGSACSPMNVPVMFTVVTLTPQALSFTAGANNTLPAAQTAQITANSTTPASFTLSTSSTGNWLKATANQSTTPATLTVSLASLPAQDDTGTVTILQTNGPPALPPNSTYNYAVITVNYKAAPAVPLPVITQVFNAAGNQPGIAPGAFISIKGSNLTAGPTDNWNSLLTGTQLPTAIDGVTVTIGGKLAYPSYVSPTQINAAAPDAGYGSMSVTVTTPNGTSAAFSTVSTEYSPAFFLFPGNQPVATHGDYSLAAKNGTFPGTTTIPAKPGEFIILWGTGFGPTSPPVPAGAVVPSDQIYSLPALPVLILNNQACLVYGAALVSGGGPEHQVNMQVPASMPNGDWPLSVVVNGVASPTGVLLTVHN
jgi:uncharacterized protein (TIGR03437 family)